MGYLDSCVPFSKMFECIDYGTKVCLFVLKRATKIDKNPNIFASAISHK